MNESLHRALLRAHLSEEDVATRLQVDPKTVHRWLEGRVPYPRHRWLLAAALGLEEADLWPQFGASRSWLQEVQSIYAHCKDIPRETWLRLFSDAQERIDILSGSALLLAADPEVLAILANRAALGVKERICLCDPISSGAGNHDSPDETPAHTRNALTRFNSLLRCGDVEIRLHSKQLNNSLYRADNMCLIAPTIYGVSFSQTPVILLERAAGIYESYLKGFENVWAKAREPRTDRG